MLEPKGGDVLGGCFARTDATVTTTRANGDGVQVESSGDTGGGDAVGAGDLISGNTHDDMVRPGGRKRLFSELSGGNLEP